MIRRESRAVVREGQLEAFLDALSTEVGDYRNRYDGLLSDEIVVENGPPAQVTYRTVWRDEAAVAAFAGPDWRTSPVTFPNEDHYLSEALRLDHVTLPGSATGAQLDR